VRPGLRSTPPSQPSPYRQLGSGGQQPVRVQMIIGLVVGLVLVAVPLYLWRRPEQGAKDSDQPVPEDAGLATIDGAAPYIPLVDAAAATRVKLGPFEVIRCEDASNEKTPPDRCDHIEFFEKGLARAIEDNALCAPSTKTGATISFVMDISFRRKELKLYRGKSSTISKAKSEELFRCVKKALPTPDWSTIPHQHTHYVVGVKATYPPSDTF
jgi:hypothetical protein